MADEALRELLAEHSQRAAEWLSASHDCNPGSKMYARYRGEAEKVRRYADALEFALSELARLRAERDSRMDQSKTVTAATARDHPTDE